MYKHFFKRAIDLLLSFIGIIVLIPVWLILTIAIFINDPGPIFFTQKRVGKKKKLFKILKFRTMKTSTPHDMPTHMLENPEQYITKVGGFLRKTSLDELPQIFNIFAGQMSIIGPRPALWNQDDLIAERDKYGANDVKPGLTGWAQINGRDELEIPVKAKLDGEYVEKMSFGFDCKCFFGTIKSVLKHDGVVEGGTGELHKEALAAEEKEAEEEKKSEEEKKDKQDKQDIQSAEVAATSVAEDIYRDSCGEENYFCKIKIDNMEQKKMKYSVLMSVYKNDNPEFLKIALESVYEKQTRKPDEVVIVFDGPISENLHAVLNEFQKGKEGIVKFYPQEENKGLGEALRIGSEKCTGDYIFRMDSDDYSDPKRFETQIKYLEEHPEIDVLGSDIAEFDKSPDESHLRRRVCYAEYDDIVKMSKSRNPMNHVSVCIKKSALFKAGGYIPLRYVEDYYLWVRMIGNGLKLANINETLVYVRVGNGFADRRGFKEQIDSWKVLQDYMLEHGMITSKEAKRNMFNIKTFVNTPVWVKDVLYSIFLRK